MVVLRITALSMLALLATAPLSSGAQADQRWHFGVRLPHIYLPEVTTSAWDDEDVFDDEEVYAEPRRRARGNMVYDPDLDEWVPRAREKRVRRQMVYDQYLDEWVPVERMRRTNFEEDFDPVYEIEKSARKKAKTTKSASVAKKPFVVKPLDTSAAPRKLDASLALAAPVTPKVIKPKVQAESKTASIAKPVTTTAVKPAKPAIGCSNAADIVTGYGFSGVKPKSCAGASYTFNAARAEKSYVITLSSATGEITDVKKVN